MKSTGAGSGKPTSSGAAGSGRNVRKRVMANERERERTKSLNQALELLRSRIPVAEAEKKSKIQTLRTAKEYIEFLGRVKKLSNHQANNNNNNNNSSNATISTSSAVTTAINNNNNSNHQVEDNNSHNSQQHSQHYPHKAHIHSDLQPSSTTSQPDSPLAYMFYKFRLKRQSRGNLACTKLELDPLCNPIQEVPGTKISAPKWCNNSNALPQPSHQSAQP